MAGATKAELDALRGRIGQILMSPQCQKVNFTFDSVYVDGSSFCYVALAGLSGSGFKVQVNAAQSSEAMYLPSSNTFVFKNAGYGSSAKPFEMMTIVHESTHALIDAKKRRTLMLANEVCAYIAGALFNQFRKDEGLQSFDGSTQPSGGIYREAHEVAAKMSRIMKQYQLYELLQSHGQRHSGRRARRRRESQFDALQQGRFLRRKRTVAVERRSNACRSRASRINPRLLSRVHLGYSFRAMSGALHAVHKSELSPL